MVATAEAPGEGRNNSSNHFKKYLPVARARLLELMQRINFGRIERMDVADGLPVLSSIGKAVSTLKLKGENGPRPELSAADFLLKQEIVELFNFFDELQDGVIDLIEIKHGLPFLIEVTEVPA